MNSVPSRESEELEEQIDTLKTKCENLEDHVAEKEEEFEETLWKWQEFQSDVDTCFRNLAMIEKSLDFQSLDDGELEDRRETHQVRTSYEPVRFRPCNRVQVRENLTVQCLVCLFMMLPKHHSVILFVPTYFFFPFSFQNLYMHFSPLNSPPPPLRSKMLCPFGFF